MQATTLDRLQTTAVAVTLPKTVGAATVDSWWVRPGSLINAGDTLATVGAGNMRRGIVAPVAGKVRALLVREGGTVQAGATLAYIEPHSPQSAPQAPHSAPTRPRQARPLTEPIEPPSEPVAVLELLPIGEPPATKKAKPKRERVKHRGFYILPSQEKQLKRLVADLSLDEEKPLPCNDSELVRAAIDLLTTLPAGALRATLQAYKAKEQAAKVGSGWPRPGRAGNK